MKTFLLKYEKKASIKDSVIYLW